MWFYWRTKSLGQVLRVQTPTIPSLLSASCLQFEI
ncbi:rCG51794 [Rattus norvegicus]|uniref:RCG51794 n=1 Tax=Rattus norvegicus TaxID=10116 RepID=A6K2S6_RAT|nr:rCG51794 [Rattus norvegicus]